METSDWIGIWSIATSVLTMIGTALYVSFKVGGVNEKNMSMAISIGKLEATLERNHRELRGDIAALKSNVAEIRIETAEMKVKVDELWRYHMDRLSA